TLGTPPPSRVRDPGQAGEPFLARGTFFQVPREAVPLRRGESVGQQPGERLVGGARRQDIPPRALGRKTKAGSRLRRFRRGDHEPASSFWISSWSIFCTLLFTT